MPILVRASGRKITEFGHVVRLDERGTGILPRLIPGEYLMTASPSWGESSGRISGPFPKEWVSYDRTIDKNIEIKVTRTEHGLYRLFVESRERSLAGTFVAWAFLDPKTQEVLKGGSIPLEPEAEKSRGEYAVCGEWVEQTQGLGDTKCMAAEDGPGCDLVFCVLPRDRS
jgi:hypothetical protein